MLYIQTSNSLEPHAQDAPLFRCQTRTVLPYRGCNSPVNCYTSGLAVMHCANPLYRLRTAAHNGICGGSRTRGPPRKLTSEVAGVSSEVSSCNAREILGSSSQEHLHSVGFILWFRPKPRFLPSGNDGCFLFLVCLFWVCWGAISFSTESHLLQEQPRPTFEFK